MTGGAALDLSRLLHPARHVAQGRALRFALSTSSSSSVAWAGCFLLTPIYRLLPAGFAALLRSTLGLPARWGLVVEFVALLPRGFRVPLRRLLRGKGPVESIDAKGHSWDAQPLAHGEQLGVRKIGLVLLSRKRRPTRCGAAKSGRGPWGTHTIGCGGYPAGPAASGSDEIGPLRRIRRRRDLRESAAPAASRPEPERATARRLSRLALANDPARRDSKRMCLCRGP